MAVCDVCKKRGRRLRERYAMPEYRSMIGFWPWLTVRVCDACLAAYDRNFKERLGLLAPDVLENDEPVVRQVCLACAAGESAGPWREASKWVDAQGRPVRRARFYLCDRHALQPYVDGIVVSSALSDAAQMAAVLAELPAVGADLLARVERWTPEGGTGPEGAVDFRGGLAHEETLAEAMRFWQESPEAVEAKAAWLGPVRKDYRMRYRLDLVRDDADGRRETFTVVRTAPEVFATYRTVAEAPRP